MSKDPLIGHNNSLYPENDFDEVDDDSWQISYLDIVTILLGFLIILLSVANFSDTEFFSVSGLFKSDAEEAEFITTPINKIEEQLEVALLDEITDNKIEIKRDLNDLLIRLNSDNLYLSGSATIQADALSLLNQIARAIKNNAYNDFDIEIEGHTDDVPISSVAYASNWELSTARATNLVKYFKGMGINQNRLKASGYANSRPLVPNRNAQGGPIPNNQAKNRRVTLRLFYDTPPATVENKKPKNKASGSFDSGCQYAVQLGGFSSFSNALNVATDIAQTSNLDFNITYNGRLFSVRSTSQNDLGSTITDHKTIANDLGNEDIGLIHQCYDQPEENTIPLTFQIQLGAFGSLQNANKLASTLNNRFNIDAQVKSSGDDMHRVVANSGTSLKHTIERAKFLRKETGRRNLISFSDLERSSYQFRFQIQLNTFQSEKEAIVLSDKIQTLMGLNTSVKELGAERYVLVTESFNNWENTMSTFSELSYTSYDISPIIYFLEYKSN